MGASRGSAGAVAIIPARLGSTRFPRKVLANATGKPLVQHVWERAKLATSLSRVVIATDDTSVHETVIAFGGESVMTSTSHPNGTSRLAEAAGKLDLEPDRIIVNVQGDEPELEPATIDSAVAALLNSGAPMATAAAAFPEGVSPADPNIVKVVLRLDGTALYFSRAPIPFDRDHQRIAEARVLRHVGLYVYRRSFLELYSKLPPTPLERTEQLEQLRALEHHHEIAVAIVNDARPGIDTPEQYEAFVERWSKLPLPEGGGRGVG